MSKQIDERVVSMQFDNKNFESNVKTTMSTLDRLKQSLKLDGASRGLETIDNAAKKVDMSSLSKSVETVRSTFSSLEVMAVTALANITNSAVNAGKRIASALIIQPITTGFSEYETQINAVQTILSNTRSKGTTLDNVNSALDELNTYADKTIYNFTEMTRNIGTFTAAGVDLDTSVSAIKGIANLAAVSGSSSQQASTAMYQLSQALSSGTVKLMDWNSVVNAGMGGQVFQDALKETAKVHGINVDAMIKKEGSFRETLQEGWLTSEILTETLAKFTGDLDEATLKKQGYTDEQIKNIIALGKDANDAATKVKTLTQLFDTLKEAAQSGWSQTWEILVGDFEEAKGLFTQVSDTLGELIGSSAEARNKVLEGWKDLGGRTAVIDAIKNAFEGVMSIIKPISEAFREIFPPVTAEQLANFSKGLKNLTEKFKIGKDIADKLKRTFKGIFASIDIGVQLIKALFGGFVKLLNYLAPVGKGLLGFTANLGDFIVYIDNALKSSNAFTKIIEGIGKILKPIADGVTAFGKSIINTIGIIADNAQARLSPLSILAQFIKGIFTGLGNLIGKIFPYVIKAASGIGKVIGKLMDKITTSIQNADYDSLFDIFNSGVIAAIGVFIAKFMNAGSKLLDNASGFLEKFENILDGVSEAINAFTGQIKANTLKTIATAIGILAISLVAISLIDSEKLAASLAAVAILFTELMTAMYVFSKMFENQGLKSVLKLSLLTGVIQKLAKALLVLAVALKIMGSLSWEQMGVALISLIVGLGSLVGALKILPQTDVNKSAKTIRKLASSLMVLAVALKIMGSLSWEQMGVALISTAVGLGVLVGATRILPTDGGNKAAKTITKLSSALVILAIAMKIMASISWEGLAKSLLATGVGLITLIGAVRLLPKNMTRQAVSMIALATSMVILGAALRSMSKMSWIEIAKGLTALGGSLIILVGAIQLMKTAVSGAVAMVTIAAALALFVPELKALGSMSIESIALALTSLASSLLVVGVAAKLLAPYIATILKVAGAMAILGIAIAAIGVGVSLFATALTMLAGSAGSIAVAIVTIVSSILSLIPYIIEQVAVGTIKLLQTFVSAHNVIVEFLQTILLSVIEAIQVSIPHLVEALLVLIHSILSSLAEYIPTVVNLLFDIILGLINGLAERTPELIKASVDLLMAVLVGTIDALKSIDPKILIKGTIAVGFMTVLMNALALLAGLAPAAFLGVISFGIIVAELAVVLAALGALAQIPGLEWIVNEAGPLLQSVGTAIGQFLGGIVGGFSQGASAALPQVGKDLSDFMSNMKPFIDGAKAVDASMFAGVRALAGIILTLTATNILEGLSSWITGGSSLTKFGEELVMFAPNLKTYADTIKGIDGSAIKASAIAAKTLAELAANLPNSGGIVSLFAGDNDIGTFGKQLIPFGEGMKAYSDAITGFDSEAVTASANAAKALAEMASTIPDEGGVVSWFAGDNSIAKFGPDLIALGKGMKAYSDSIVGFDSEAVIASANAAKALAEMASYIPNSGGILTWITGDNSISQFSTELILLGYGLKGYSDVIAGFDSETVMASINAAKALTEMASYIPNSGGILTWITGENSISQFGTELVELGKGLKGYSDAIAGFDSETVIASISAAKALTEMSACVPDEGGIVSWFAGDNSIAKFGPDLIALGTGLKGYSYAITGFDSEAVIASANAAKALTEMARTIPDEGGVVSWFAGDNSIAKFGPDLIALGTGLKGFSDATTGINIENITAAANVAKTLAEMTSYIPNTGGMAALFVGEQCIAKFSAELILLGYGLKGFSDALGDGINAEAVTSAATAGKALAEMTSYVPNTGGIAALFVGEQCLAKFSAELILLGKGLKGFSDALGDGINAEAVTSAATAGKALAEMTSYIPNTGGIAAWFAGETNMAGFAENLPKVGKGLKGFSDSLEGINPENLTAGATAGKALSEMTKTVPDNTEKLGPFGDNLKTFGANLKVYYSAVSEIDATKLTAISTAVTNVVKSISNMDTSKIDSVVSAIKKIIEMMEDMADISSSTTSGFCEALDKLGKSGVDAFVKAFENSDTTMSNSAKTLIDKFVTAVEKRKVTLTNAGKDAIEKFVKGISTSSSKATTACRTLVTKCVNAIKSKNGEFKTAGVNLVKGFASGITSTTFLAKAKAKAMAAAAAEAAKKELDEHSPSKVFYGIGKFAGLGFVNAIGDYVSKARSAGSGLADASIEGMNDAISKVSDFISNDIDAQPTIRPVLDLSDVESGASAIGGMLSGRRTLSLNTQSIGALSASMEKLQNGRNSNELVSTIKALRKDIADMPRNTYSIGGISVNEEGAVADAIKTLVRVAKIERRA